jgi:hypothetical protein
MGLRAQNRRKSAQKIKKQFGSVSGEIANQEANMQPILTNYHLFSREHPTGHTRQPRRSPALPAPHRPPFMPIPRRPTFARTALNSNSGPVTAALPVLPLGEDFSGQGLWFMT